MHGEEEWKILKRCPEYEISNHGRVRRRITKRGSSAGKILKLILRRGYFTVYLSPVKSRFSVHRLALEEFITECPPCHECNHKDGNKLNNHISNLEWVTSSENKIHAYRNGLKYPSIILGSDNHSSKLNEKNIISIRNAYNSGSMSQRKIANQYGICKSTVADIVRRVTWKHVT